MNNPTINLVPKLEDSVVFEPFAIGPDHSQHHKSTSIIALEESGRVFCSLCLEKAPMKNIDRVSESLYDQYVRNMLEALDQHGDRKQLRCVVLPILEVMLRRRPILMKSDHDFHNLLRVINKTMAVEGFENREFTSLAKIFAGISNKFVDSNPVPLMSVWNATKSMLAYVEKQFINTFVENIGGLSEDAARFLGSSAAIVKTYLKIVTRSSIQQVSDLIFPLRENDIPLNHCRSYYIGSQRQCLKFVSETLIPFCWPYIDTSNRPPLQVHEKIVVSELFDALCECFQAAVRLNDAKFLSFLEKKDILHAASYFIIRNAEREHRYRVRIFLKKFVTHHIIADFGDDEQMKECLAHKDVVETNHKNAIAFGNDEQRFHRTIFYLLVNFVAFKQKSKYFHQGRVRRVLKCVNPNYLNLGGSDVFMKVYNFIVASVIHRVESFDNIETFMLQTWKAMRQRSNHTKFNEQFCFDEKVFLWAHNHADFQKVTTVSSIKKLFELATKKGILRKLISTMFKSKHYERLISLYFKQEESTSIILNGIIVESESIGRPLSNEAPCEELICKLSALLLHHFYSSIQTAISGLDNPRRCSKIHRLINAIVLMVKNCDNFALDLDRRFVSDIFKVLERLYSMESSEKIDEILASFNEFITSLITNNDPSLMSILQHLNYHILGYMYNRLADYVDGDNLCESIARLLVAYDRIDYPLQHDVLKSLYPMALSIMNWALSGNLDLHLLALSLAERILRTELDTTTRTCIVTGLIHMLTGDKSLLQSKHNIRLFLSISETSELLYNPLLESLLDVAPDVVKQEVASKLEAINDANDRLESPAPSFGSSQSGDFEETHVMVCDILSHLNDDPVGRVDETCEIPNTLFASEAIRDQHSYVSDVDGWERTAHQVTTYDDSL